MKRLAVVNFAQTVDHLNSEAMRSFLVTTQAVNRQAEGAEGHIASAIPCDTREDLSFFDRDWGKWGKFVVPHYYEGGCDVNDVYEASALSLWTDIKSLHSYVYTHMHLRAIRRKKNWFASMPHPNYAMWWTEDWPTWEEATRRLVYQEEHDLSPYSFTFRHLFDQNGRKIKLTEAAV